MKLQRGREWQAAIWTQRSVTNGFSLSLDDNRKPIREWRLGALEGALEQPHVPPCDRH